MPDGISVNDFAKAINEALAEFETQTVDATKAAVDKAARQAVKDLKATSPRRTGEYAGSWKSKAVKSLSESKHERIVYVDGDKARLTSLLEYGHAKVVGGRARVHKGRVKAYPHIAAARDRAVQTLVASLKEGIK